MRDFRIPWRFVIAAGLVAGTLDIVFAMAWWATRAGTPARAILQSVAAGLLGRASFTGGAATAMLGLVLHFTIALAMAACYFIVAARWKALAARPLVYGAAYGIVLHGVMTRVVVPLSANPRTPTDPVWIAASVAAHVALVGIPIACAAHLAWRNARSSA